MLSTAEINKPQDTDSFQGDLEVNDAREAHDTLMNEFTKAIDNSTHEDAAIAETGIHARSSKAKIPSKWHSHWLNSKIYNHIKIPERFKTSVEGKYGNFIYIRETGELHYEEMPIYTRIGMHLLFVSYGYGKFLNTGRMHELFAKESLRQGTFFTSPESVKQIPSFIKHYGIDMKEYEKSNVEDYKNFNEFFTRVISPKYRPIANPDEPNVIVSAADCRLNVFDSVDKATQFWIKGKQFTLANFLQDEKLATQLEGGSLAIFRLAPQDYHRFHIPAVGKVQSINTISGTYFTVNPCAVKENLDVFTENHRSITTVESHHGFNFAVVSIGALLVGSICMTNAEPNAELKKGQEMGYFQYGGSTVVAVFPKNTIQWDADLKANSEKSTETLVKMGERIGAYKV